MLNLLARGLSPLTRGKQAASATSGGGLPVHPRSRRENLTENTHAGIEAGASPLTRGKQGYRVVDGVGVGLIPAHAGKTDRWRRRSGRWSAHPRSRRENLVAWFAALTLLGSSPLTRGRLLDGVHHDAGPGFIPAHAGKTTSQPAWIAASWDHPHSRGESGWRRV